MLQARGRTPSVSYLEAAKLYELEDPTSLADLARAYNKNPELLPPGSLHRHERNYLRRYDSRLEGEKTRHQLKKSLGDEGYKSYRLVKKRLEEASRVEESPIEKNQAQNSQSPPRTGPLPIALFDQSRLLKAVNEARPFSFDTPAELLASGPFQLRLPSSVSAHTEPSSVPSQRKRKLTEAPAPPLKTVRLFGVNVQEHAPA